ncbi:MAG: signal peptide peptidase SppA [Actinobacteria bacterium]|nr:signal peptide peptidase SppA [Actinomycetota bacterium]
MEAGNGQNREGNGLAGGADGGRGDSPRRSRTRGLVIGGAIAGVLLFLTLGAVALVLLVGPGGSGGGGGGAEPPETFRERYVSGEGSDKIAVLPVAGTIAAEAPVAPGSATVSPETLRNQLRQATEDRRVRAVVLEIDSPGGGVVPTDQMHESIQDFKEETGKPVVVSMGQTAASGGYYIATAADRIFANENTLTGSLGVIFSYLNFTEAADEYGIEQEVVKSGPFKDIGSLTREPTEEELEILQTYVNEGYDQFVQVIVEGRDLPEEEVRELADGRVYSGQQAETLGLVDELGDLERAAEASRELAGVEEATVVRYQRQSPGLLELLQARLAPPEPEALQVLETAGLNLTPELQYLYRP